MEPAVSEGYADFRGYRTWYRVAGELGSGATPLLALHGGPGSTHHYFAPLERLAAERPVVVYDQIGSGAEGIAGLILSSTLASVDQWAAEQLKLRDALPADVVEVFERHERAGTYDNPEYERAMEAYFDRHFYRGPKPRAE